MLSDILNVWEELECIALQGWAWTLNGGLFVMRVAPLFNVESIWTTRVFEVLFFVTSFCLGGEGSGKKFNPFTPPPLVDIGWKHITGPCGEVEFTRLETWRVHMHTHTVLDSWSLILHPCGSSFFTTQMACTHAFSHIPQQPTPQFTQHARAPPPHRPAQMAHRSIYRARARRVWVKRIYLGPFFWSCHVMRWREKGKNKYKKRYKMLELRLTLMFFYFFFTIKFEIGSDGVRLKLWIKFCDFFGGFKKCLMIGVVSGSLTVLKCWRSRQRKARQRRET